MDINIFEGMRTLAANIAVEIPESEVDSTHLSNSIPRGSGALHVYVHV